MRFLVWTLPEHLDIKLVLPAGTDYELQGIYFDTDESDVEVHRKFQVLLDDVKKGLAQKRVEAS